MNLKRIQIKLLTIWCLWGIVFWILSIANFHHGAPLIRGYSISIGILPSYAWDSYSGTTALDFILTYSLTKFTLIIIMIISIIFPFTNYYDYFINCTTNYLRYIWQKLY